MQFLDDFEKQCGTQASVKRLRDHSSYHAFMTKWSLPVYYQIRYNVCKVMSPAGLLCQGLNILFYFTVSLCIFLKILLFVKLRQIFKTAILCNCETVTLLFAHGERSLKLFTLSTGFLLFLTRCYPSCELILKFDNLILFTLNHGQNDKYSLV